MLIHLDRWMDRNPWHPRVLPFMVYVCLIPVISMLRDWQPTTYLLTYTVQCTLVVWLLWRYRKLLPELTLSFHWLAIPTGVGVFIAWIYLGLATTQAFPNQFDDAGWDFFQHMTRIYAWSALSIRLLGMSVVVPLFEELFIRSLLLRSLHRFRPTAIGTLQVIQDLPLIGEWLMHTPWGDKSNRHPPIFAVQFQRHALGALSAFGVFASTFVFMIHHTVRDWPGCIVCALAYCALLAFTGRKNGLGPVCWAHGITNALLWGYTLYTGDWQFL